MELVKTTVETTRSAQLPKFDETLICPIGDFQYGAELCDIERLERHIEWCCSHKNAYFIGMGDYVDMGSPGNRARLRSAFETNALYDVVESSLEEKAEEHLDKLLKILKPTRGRWLGMIEGHHFWKFSDNSTSDTRLCDALDAPFLGSSAIVNVQFPQRKSKGHKIDTYINIFAHHGQGSGELQSSPLNKLERYMNAWEDVDVFLMGHHHKKVSAKLPRIRPVFEPGKDHGELKQRNTILAGTGSFLKGYVEGNTQQDRPMGNYVEQRMLRPITLGAVVIYARPDIKNGVSRVDLDIML